MDIGKKLRKYRNERKLSTRAVESAIKIGNGSISRWENNVTKPTFESIVSLCKYYGVDIRSLAS